MNNSFTYKIYKLISYILFFIIFFINYIFISNIYYLKNTLHYIDHFGGFGNNLPENLSQHYL